MATPGSEDEPPLIHALPPPDPEPPDPPPPIPELDELEPPEPPEPPEPRGWSSACWQAARKEDATSRGKLKARGLFMGGS
jgi:hypothetical protein